MCGMTRHVLFILGLVAVEIVALSGRALYCRDPDTGKLYAVNSTWPSSTFCGNYTCKLRRRNIPQTEYTPIRQINITNVNDSKENIAVTIEERTEPEIERVIHKDTTVEDESVNRKKDVIEKKESKAREVTKMLSDMAKNKDDERYLTEKEIKSISDVLQTVKKSDLDAIVDIYNLAQEIYNEIDKSENDEIRGKVNAISDEKIFVNPKKSYWYDPLLYKLRPDMDFESSNPVIATVDPKRDVHTYFHDSTNQNIVKMPYYYPISAFHRTASYMHQPTAPTMVERPKPCPKKPDMQGEQNLIKPSYLLPYPFSYVHPYNYSNYPSHLYQSNLYPYNNYFKERHYQPYYNAYITQVPKPNAVPSNPHLQEDVPDVEHEPVNEDMLGKVLAKTKENLMPDWKTEELSSQILDELRANIDTSKILKAFPFRNKIKLEKVGKVIKLDELSRSRRSFDEKVEEKVVKALSVKQETVREREDTSKRGTTTKDTPAESGEYETYLEKTMCQTKTIPGYFRFGNLTQPYPECCPQLINNR